MNKSNKVNKKSLAVLPPDHQHYVYVIMLETRLRFHCGNDHGIFRMGNELCCIYC